MSPLPPNVTVVETYEESTSLRKTFGTPVICLQANFQKVRHNELNYPSLIILKQNKDLFFELAEKNPQANFILITHGTYCHWAFYEDGEIINTTMLDERTWTLCFNREAITENAAQFEIND